VAKLAVGQVRGSVGGANAECSLSAFRAQVNAFARISLPDVPLDVAAGFRQQRLQDGSSRFLVIAMFRGNPVRLLHHLSLGRRPVLLLRPPRVRRVGAGHDPGAHARGDEGEARQEGTDQRA
jgi:hypothetical protein